MSSEEGAESERMRRVCRAEESVESAPLSAVRVRRWGGTWERVVLLHLVWDGYQCWNGKGEGGRDAYGNEGVHCCRVSQCSRQIEGEDSGGPFPD
jgi:hypothetical protein